MKPGPVIVNTACAGLVDQAALAADLDVFAAEPLNPAAPLLGLTNVLLAPHVAQLSTGTFARSFSIAAENVRRLASGEALLHRAA